MGVWGGGEGRRAGFGGGSRCRIGGGSAGGGAAFGGTLRFFSGDFGGGGGVGGKLVLGLASVEDNFTEDKFPFPSGAL